MASGCIIPGGAGTESRAAGRDSARSLGGIRWQCRWPEETRRLILPTCLILPTSLPLADRFLALSCGVSSCLLTHSIPSLHQIRQQGTSMVASSTFGPEPAPALVIALAPAQLQPQTQPHTLPSSPALSLHLQSPCPTSTFTAGPPDGLPGETLPGCPLQSPCSD